MQSEHSKFQEREWFYTLSLWSPPIILMLRICSSSSRSSNLSVLVVAGSPDLTSTSLRLPISRFPCTTHLLMNGLYFCGWSNLLTKDQTWSNYEKQEPIKVATVQSTKLESNMIYALTSTKIAFKLCNHCRPDCFTKINSLSVIPFFNIFFSRWGKLLNPTQKESLKPQSKTTTSLTKIETCCNYTILKCQFP